MTHFNKKVGAFITKADVDKARDHWKKNHPGGTESVFVGADILADLLAKPGAEGLRIYFGQDEKGVVQLIYAAADADGKVIETTTASLTAAASASSASTTYGDSSLPCPPYC